MQIKCLYSTLYHFYWTQEVNRNESKQNVFSVTAVLQISKYSFDVAMETLNLFPILFPHFIAFTICTKCEICTCHVSDSPPSCVFLTFQTFRSVLSNRRCDLGGPGPRGTTPFTADCGFESFSHFQFWAVLLSLNIFKKFVFLYIHNNLRDVLGAEWRSKRGVNQRA